MSKPLKVIWYAFRMKIKYQVNKRTDTQCDCSFIVYTGNAFIGKDGVGGNCYIFSPPLFDYQTGQMMPKAKESYTKAV